MTHHTHTDRLSAAAHAEIAQLAKAHRETVNRSFGQHIRYQIARQLRIRSEMAK